MSGIFDLQPTAVLNAINDLKKVIEDLPKVQTEVAKAATSAAKDAAKKETEISLKAVGLDPNGPSNPVQAVVNMKLQGVPPSPETTPIVIPPEPCPPGLTLDKDNKCKVTANVRGGAKKQTRKKRSRRPKRSMHTLKNLRK